MQNPRWFKFGSISYTYATQKAIVAEATGDKVQLHSSVALRRKEGYKDFVTGSGSDGYANIDVPMIAFVFKDDLTDVLTRFNEEYVAVCDEGVASVSRRAFDSEELLNFENLLRLMLAASNEYGQLRISNDKIIVQIPSNSTRTSGTITQRPPPERDLQVTPPPNPTFDNVMDTREQSHKYRRYSSASTSSRNSIPDALLLINLGKFLYCIVTDVIIIFLNIL
jgi:hypothetical protein